MNNRQQLKTGGDPRTLPDYAALREELAKLSHPARPDVDWQRIEQLCLSLFRQNGMELQTACWYTQARIRIAGMSGLNEGLAILEALLSHQWGALWPQPVHARMEILTGFSQRLQAALRTLTLHYADLPLIYRAEQHLSVMRDVLQRLELKNVSQIGNLCLFMHNVAVRLENMDTDDGDNSAVVLPGGTGTGNRDSGILESIPEEEPLIYVARQEPMPRIIPGPATPQPQPWKSFVAGMLTMLALTAVIWGAFKALYPMPVEVIPTRADETALKELGKLSPLWRQNYGFYLAGRASQEQAGELKNQWQQYITGNALPLDTLSGWHRGMEGLANLTRRLNQLDERKGKYLTGSELKSMVFAITQDFSRAAPVEEQLYQLSLTERGAPLPEALMLQTDMHFNQLLNRYTLIKQQNEMP